jgi:subtilase-type serine protease
VEDTRTTVASTGLRFGKELKASAQKICWLHVRGDVGYRRAPGDRNQLAHLAFNAGDTFMVSGAPLADGAMVAELRLPAWLTECQQLELSYSSQFGDEGRDHSLNARWSVQL